MAKSALLLPAGAGRSRQGRRTVLAAGSFHPDGCLTQPMNGLSRIGRAGSSLGIRSELVLLQLTPSPSERSLVTHIPSGSPQGCPLRFGIMQMPGLLPPPCQLEHLVSPQQPERPPGEMGTQSGESLFPEQVIVSGMRLKFKSPVPNPGNSRLPAQGLSPGPCNPWQGTAIAASASAKIPHRAEPPEPPSRFSWQGGSSWSQP